MENPKSPLFVLPSEIVIVLSFVYAGKLPFAALMLQMFCPFTGAVTIIFAKFLLGTNISNKTKVKMLNANFVACEGLRIELLRTRKTNIDSFFNSFGYWTPLKIEKTFLMMD